MKIGTLIIEMAANVARLRADMEQANRVVGTSMQSIERSVNQAKAALGALGLGLGLREMLAYAKGVLDAADALNDLSERVGITATQLSRLQYAAKLSGSSIDDLQLGLKTLSGEIAKAGSGDKAALDLLQRLGFSAKEAAGQMPTLDVALERIATRFAGWRDGAGKNAIAADAFGKSGTRLINMLNQGAEGLREMQRESDRLGATMSDRDIKAMAEFNDELDRMRMRMQRAVADGITPMLGPIRTLLEETGKLAAEWRKMGEQSGAVKFAEDVVVSFARILEAITFLLKGLRALIGSFEVVFADANLAGEFFKRGGALGLAFKANREALARELEARNKVLEDASARYRDLLEYDGAALSNALLRRFSTPSAPGAASGGGSPGGPDRRPDPPARANQAAIDAARKEAEEFAKLRAKILGEQSGVDADFYENLGKLNTALGKGRIQYAEYIALAEAYIKQQKFVTDGTKARQEALEKQAQSEQLIRTREEESEAAAEASYQSMLKAVAAIENETAALQMSNQDREIAIQLRALEAEGIKRGTLLWEEAERRIRQAVDAQAVARQAKEARERAAEEALRMAEDLERALTDSFFRAAEAGRGVFETLRDALRGMFNNLILRPVVQAVFRPVAAGITGAFGGSAMAGDGGPGGASLMAGASALSGMQAFGGLLTGSTWAAGANNLGAQMLLSSNGGMMGAAGEWLMSNSGTIGAAGAWGTGLLAGHMGGRLLSNGFALSGSGNSTVNLGTAIGAALAGPLGAAIGGLAGGLANRLFGRKLAGAGIEGTLGGEAGFAGNSFEFYRGGLFRSDRTVRTPLAGDLSSALANSVEDVRAQVDAYAEALALPVDAMRAYTQALNLDTRNLSPEQIQQRLAEALEAFAQGYADQLGAAFDGLRRHGETTLEAMRRLAAALVDVNTVLGTLGHRLFDVGTAGADAAAKLADLFGGAGAFTSAGSSYLDAFYSEAERAAIGTRQVAAALAEFGIALPQSRAQFRALVEAQDLTTDAGRRAYATLLQFAPTFDEVARVAEETAATVRDAWGQIADSIIGEIERIRGATLSGSPGGLAALQSQFAIATAQARAGDQEAARALPGLSSALLEAARDNAPTLVEYRRIRARTAASLGGTAEALRALAATAEADAAITAPEASAPLIDAVNQQLRADNALLRSAVDALREEVRAGLATVARNTADTAKLLDAWDANGLPPEDPIGNAA